MSRNNQKNVDNDGKKRKISTEDKREKKRRVPSETLEEVLNRHEKTLKNGIKKLVNSKIQQYELTNDLAPTFMVYFDTNLLQGFVDSIQIKDISHIVTSPDLRKIIFQTIEKKKNEESNKIKEKKIIQSYSSSDDEGDDENGNKVDNMHVVNQGQSNVIIPDSQGEAGNEQHESDIDKAIRLVQEMQKEKLNNDPKNVKNDDMGDDLVEEHEREVLRMQHDQQPLQPLILPQQPPQQALAPQAQTLEPISQPGPVENLMLDSGNKDKIVTQVSSQEIRKRRKEAQDKVRANSNKHAPLPQGNLPPTQFYQGNNESEEQLNNAFSNINPPKNNGRPGNGYQTRGTMQNNNPSGLNALQSRTQRFGGGNGGFYTKQNNF